MNPLQFFTKLATMILPKPVYDPDAYDKATVTKIHKAWVEGGGVDLSGCLWIDVDSLPAILRTTRPRVEVLLEQVERAELQEIDNKLYLYGPEALKRIAVEKTRAGTNEKRLKYLKLSMEMYQQLDDSGAIDDKKHKFQFALLEAKKSLKGDRLEKIHTDTDELTGKPLSQDAQFSHIRAFHAYPAIGLKIENGLIVNPETHAVITKQGVVNEKQLLKLCNLPACSR